MRLLPILTMVSTLLTAAPAMAETTGCFGRSYAPEHLAANPGQQVREMRARLRKDPNGDPAAKINILDIRLQLRDDSREFTIPLNCHAEAGGLRCSSDDCEAGHARPEFTGNGTLRLKSDYLNADPVNAPDDDGSCDRPQRRAVNDLGADGRTQVPTTFVLYARDARECRWK